ncbi:hypothetical protein GGTG_13746 [Gaeumannomyces tritici R3-111a-1]|uniref:t-SNARE coiled-coil homology domain-containing protein n=1 Tax=Gaeumannomyces tritici (strain R3-111a-1) TaxID=644352 RepID=J3PJQ8_GAET3|nr:hypothetical protein GGTG_13746 [Gaeumannomyces tritici R3-111a-1]EJT68683.1 hypothetical protein GGTG_13746 [Gaeumannomyces tritici R3-111a-1]
MRNKRTYKKSLDGFRSIQAKIYSNNHTTPGGQTTQGGQGNQEITAEGSNLRGQLATPGGQTTQGDQTTQGGQTTQEGQGNQDITPELSNLRSELAETGRRTTQSLDEMANRFDIVQQQVQGFDARFTNLENNVRSVQGEIANVRLEANSLSETAKNLQRQLDSSGNSRPTAANVTYRGLTPASNASED